MNKKITWDFVFSTLAVLLLGILMLFSDQLLYKFAHLESIPNFVSARWIIVCAQAFVGVRALIQIRKLVAIRLPMNLAWFVVMILALCLTGYGWHKLDIFVSDLAFSR